MWNKILIKIHVLPVALLVHGRSRFQFVDPNLELSDAEPWLFEGLSGLFWAIHTILMCWERVRFPSAACAHRLVGALVKVLSGNPVCEIW